ncbi:MAG: hypothetical protein IH624_12115 [Phycisphaerae bacterium]|nr:hypothetical protein [Phycisphaerae bacterium]
MAAKGTLKRLHFASTVWFVGCAAFLLVLAMRQAGAAWWLIWSLSGYSLIIVFVLVSIYLFALYRGVVRSDTAQEYPLTSSPYYMTFYDLCPFLGALAALLGGAAAVGITALLSTIAMGSLATTFFVWVILDPAIGLVEMWLPVSRRLRQERLAAARQQRLARQVESDQLLEDLQRREALNYEQWQPVLAPMAERLAAILEADQAASAQHEAETVELGAAAWRLGGLACMRRLHEMARAEHVRHSNAKITDCVTLWWDGIGGWRSPSLNRAMA